MRKIVYIAGPMTNGGTLSPKATDAHVRVAMKTAADLMEVGFAPICPQLTHFLQELYPQPYERWMECDIPLVNVADCVLRLKGQSKGADRECLFAIDNGIPVYTSLKDLIEGETSASHK